MKLRALRRGVLLSLWLCHGAVGQPSTLEVASAGPTGEIAKLTEANEIRVIFSEPMVALGKIPPAVSAPFFHTSPAISGSFRWSGTRTLLFTPASALSFATRYVVTIDTSAVSQAGHRIAKDYRFSFTTPTLRLLRTSWYRKTGRFDSPVVFVLYFNQPVQAESLAGSIIAHYEPHEFAAPPLPRGVERWKTLDPAGFAAFEAKAKGARAVAPSSAPVSLVLAKTWNKSWFPAKPELAVLETAEAPSVEGWIRIGTVKGARGAQGDQASGEGQSVVVKLEPALFVEGFRCDTSCDPDRHNPLRLRGGATPARLRRALKIADVTQGPRAVAVAASRKASAEAAEEEETSLYPRTQSRYDESSQSWWSAVTLEEAGYALRPARTYRATVDASFQSTDGQTLGYTWMGELENWHQSAFVNFGSGHGVWESSGGPELPFNARNLKTISQWLSPLSLEELLPTIVKEEAAAFRLSPPGPARPRRLAPAADKMQSYGLDLKGVLSAGGTGLLWAAVQDAEPIEKAHQDPQQPIRASLIQVTNLGISVKDSPQNTLVFVTRLDNGAAVPGARVSIRTRDNQIFWSSTTAEDGTAIAPKTDLRDPKRWNDLHFLVTAEKEGDLAYVGSNWNEGIAPWMFNVNYDLSESKPLLRGSVFTDRGVYKLGEEVHLKALLRSDTAEGMRLLPRDTEVALAVTDSHGAAVARKTLKLSEWSSAEATWNVPAEGPLGHYAIVAKVAGQNLEVDGGFLVAAYRRPDFRVDANLAGESSLAGVRLTGLVTGKYLFGAPMAGRPAQWTYSRRLLHAVPRAVSERFPEEHWVFLDNTWEERRRPEEETLQSKEGALDGQGRLKVDLPTKRDAGEPYEYRFEGDVTDLSRQRIAGHTSFRVDPAPWYIGIQHPPFFADVSGGFDTQIVASDLEGASVAGVPVVVALKQVQWHSVRRGEGKGFYTWETEKREVAAGRWEITTSRKPAPLHVPLPRGGYYVLSATARDREGHRTTTKTSFYALGAGYTAWERYDHNRIDLIPEKKTYRPGDTARILVKSPWEKATALLTTEREGVRTQKRFDLTSTQQTVEVAIVEADIPNVFVSVLLVKGRTGSYAQTDASDPGKPSYRLGYTELKVEDAAKRLAVTLSADREEYRPASTARVSVEVRDPRGAGEAAEVTLWAVDYGVLSLTAYKTPQIVDSIYVAKALQVMSEDSRQNIVNRRVIVAKGADEGGGGGREDGAEGAVRRDFRVLAFWLGSITTDARGKAATEVMLPESLTTYRIMAVAGDKASRFGWAEREIRVSKPLLLKAAFPRFLAVGDSATFGSVLHNQTGQAGSAIVTMQSLDKDVLEIAEEPRKVVEIGGRASAEVRFSLRAKSIGKARLRMTAKLSGETDAFEDALPVEILSTPEVVAAYGIANPSAQETIELPGGILPGFGGLHVELSSTALVGLSEGARYLIDYPYGCAEQRASSAVALVLAADLGEAFRIPGVDSVKLKETARATLKELEAFQCGNGGFAFWKGSCSSVSPYLTSYVLSVYQRAQRLGYAVNRSVLERAYAYLDGVLAEKPPENEGWWPMYTSWQAFAVKVLSEGGRHQDSNVNRLYGYLDRMPVFALAYLWDAMSATGETGERPENLRRRIGNAILPEGGSAHVEELTDPYLLWFWNSNVRSTAIALETFTRRGSDATLLPAMVRWLLAARRQGRWGNTQENALAMGALVEYYRKYEKEIPDFSALVTLGSETITREKFQGRSTEAKTRDVPMAALTAGRTPGTRLDLSFRKEGAGSLHYVTRLAYRVEASDVAAMDKGVVVERSYFADQGGKPGEAAIAYKPGDLVHVTLTVRVPKERRYLAVTDPLPAGFEPVEAWFATTSSSLSRASLEESQQGDWMSWWQRGGFDHVERHDDRVLLFATRLAEGTHRFSYLARATTAGVFRAAPTHAEEMYEPEVFGRSRSVTIEVK